MIVTNFSNGLPTCVLIPFFFAIGWTVPAPERPKVQKCDICQNTKWRLVTKWFIWQKKVIKQKTSVSMCLWRITSTSGVPEQYLAQYGWKTDFQVSSFEFLKNYGEFWTKAAPLHDIFFQFFLHIPTYHTHRSRYSMLPSPHFSFCLQRAFQK